MKELAVEYANLQSPAADPIYLKEIDSQRNLLEKILFIFEDFLKETREQLFSVPVVEKLREQLPELKHLELVKVEIKFQSLIII